MCASRNARHGAADGEVDVLKQPAGPLRKLQRVEPGDDATDHMPEVSSPGPPLLPGWTGAVIWIRVRSLPGPIVALIVPVVTLTLCRALFHDKANYCGDRSDRK